MIVAMILTQNKKTKISLKDYSYQSDIEHRLFLSSLPAFDIRILQELFYFGSQFALSDLRDALDCSESVLLSSLTNLSKTGLLLVKDEMVLLDRDLRKYFEFQVAVFNPDFEPDFQYFQGLLKKIPISALPVWYNIPKTSDTIFGAIVEKFLATPKLYERHLQDVVFDEPCCREILDMLLGTPTLTLRSDTIRTTLTLSREKLQQCLLLLEFHAVCAARYILEEGCWVEVVTVFREYKEHVMRERAIEPKRAIQSPSLLSISYFKDPFGQYKSAIAKLEEEYAETFGSVEKSVRELERSLKICPDERWVYFDDFVYSLSASVGKQSSTSLERVGKKWRYSAPQYCEQEREFIKRVIFELFFQMNITSCGVHDGKPCFFVTAFGRIALGD